jgi:phosphoribosylformylglycinamidine synthase subunit PurSL
VGVVAVSSGNDIHRLEIRFLGNNPRAHALLNDAYDLGLTSVRAIDVVDIYYINGDLSSEHRTVLERILIDPLLQTASWGTTNSSCDHFVETALHAGVTDAASMQLKRIAVGLGIDATTVITAKRFDIVGKINASELDQLVRKLLANPVIEYWSVDVPVAPAVNTGFEAKLQSVEVVPLAKDATDIQLQKLNIERGLALDIEELRAVRDHYDGRGVRDIELESIAQTWSEHCAHKTFRATITTDSGEILESLIDQLRETTQTIAAPFVVSAFVGNAGVISFVEGTSVALKCETHNHPSAVEPFGGANTGIGGVIRDVLGAAHLPIACTNILCFGLPDTNGSDLPEGVFHPRRIRAGVVAGIADYGNKIGLPTVAGAVLYDSGYTANPLVYAGCIGVAHRDYVAVMPQPGDRVVVLGGRTGRDGLRGATFSSMTMDATTGDVAGASVQIGDPITEKLLIDVLGKGQHLFRAITDCGAGGLSSAIGEMAEGVGASVELSELPLKYPGLSPWEIWLSEAQERMVVAVEDVKPLQEACRAYGVECTDIGEFTGDGRLVVHNSGEVVFDMDTYFLHSGRPQRNMTAIMPTPHREVMSREQFQSVFGDIDIVWSLKQLLQHPNISSKEAIIHRYDHEIRGATLVRPLVGAQLDGHADAVVLAEPLDTHGLAIGIGVNPWFGEKDPEHMALSVIDEAIRNVVAVGADPEKVALLDNFSWGDPKQPTTLGHLVAAVQGCCNAALAYRAPFVSGKDSLNNEYFGSDGERHSVPPTLVITAVAHVPDADATVTPDLKEAANILIVLGNTLCEFGASHLSKIMKLSFSGVVPGADATAPERYRSLHRAIRNGLIRSCHDVSEGGIAVAIAEMAIGGRLGVDMSSCENATDAQWLYSESNGRFIVEVAPHHVPEVLSIFADASCILGIVTEDEVLKFSDSQIVSVTDLCNSWKTQQ